MHKACGHTSVSPLAHIYSHYANAGPSAAAARRALELGIDSTRVIVDIHTQGTGGVEAARFLLNRPPVPGFDWRVMNLETNAGTHDQRRALDEASDLIDFFGAAPPISTRLLARTASFCSGAAAQFDTWDQGVAFFLPNATWLQPPGHVHTMFSETWAERSARPSTQPASPHP